MFRVWEPPRKYTRKITNCKYWSKVAAPSICTIKKRRRFRPSTITLKEIRCYQKSVRRNVFQAHIKWFTDHIVHFINTEPGFNSDTINFDILEEAHSLFIFDFNEDVDWFYLRESLQRQQIINLSKNICLARRIHGEKA